MIASAARFSEPVPIPATSRSTRARPARARRLMGPPAVARPVVTLLERPGCHLCDEALAELEAMRAGGAAFEIERVDIEGDDELMGATWSGYPVTRVDGEVVSELPRPRRLRSAARYGSPAIEEARPPERRREPPD